MAWAVKCKYPQIARWEINKSSSGQLSNGPIINTKSCIILSFSDDQSQQEELTPLTLQVLVTTIDAQRVGMGQGTSRHYFPHARAKGF